MDDLLSGTEEISDAIEIRIQISQMINSVGFALNKWASNIPEALQGVQSDLPTQELHDAQVVSTQSEMFLFRIDLPPTATVLTKRLILS